MLAVIVPHFNPAGFQSPVQNYKAALAGFRTQYDPAHIYPVELLYDNQQPVEPFGSWVEGTTKSRFLWQKEALFNLAVNALPAFYDKVALFDADISFLNSSWAEQTESALEEYDLIQPFSECHWTSRKYELTHKRLPCCRTCRFPSPGDSHCGFAWAFKRSVLDELGGLFWQDITGANDGVLSACLFGNDFIISDSLRGEAEKYKRKFESLRLRPGYIDGAVVHAWHGSPDNRQYKTRHQILDESGYHPHDTKLVNGIVEWNCDKQILVNRMRKYFIRRKEDG